MDEARDLAVRREEGDLGWPEIAAWLAANADTVRHGFVRAELVVAPAAYESLPGIGNIWLNPAGETLWRKKIVARGTPYVKIAVVVVDPAEGMMLG